MSNAEDVTRLDAAWPDADDLLLVVASRPSPRTEWARTAARQVSTDAGDGLYALLTSGSTGAPKLVVGTRARSERLTTVLHERQDLDPVGETLLVLPPTYSYAFVNQWLWARVHGRDLVVTDGFADVAALGAALAAADRAMICLVGSQVPLLERYFGEAEFPGVIRVNFAGGRFPQERLDVVRSVFPDARIFNNFGCAEALPRLTVREAHEAERSDEVGWPLEGIELSTDDDGAVRFRSPYGAIGLVEGDRWQAIGPETWTPTGDTGEILPSGQCRIFGRTGDVFKRHGEKVASSDLLGTALSAWHGQATIVRDIDQAGEEGAVLVLSPPPSDADVRAVLQAFRRRHPRAHWPLRIESVSRFRDLDNGKIDVLSIAGDPTKEVHWWQRT